MGKKKRMVLLVLGIIILGIAIYQYPLQKAFAQKAFKAYIDEQGIDPDNIAIKKLVKDWKQGGYLIVVTFNDDTNNKYYYHYEVWTHKKGEPLRFNRMTLTIIDEKNSVVLEYPYDGRRVQPDLCAAYHPINTLGGDDDPCRDGIEVDCPFVILTYIEAGNALHLTASAAQLLRQ